MGTRSFADVAPTAATIALNAYIFGYGGHSLVTPHAALKQLWWTDARIERKITRAFVVSKLRGEERQFLDRPLAFGEGLTDDTYMEWILDRAKRLFLILTEIGVPDQIFGCIDDSWDDDDLPISLDSVSNLELSYEEDETLNRRFFDTQFIYLLRELRAGAHIDYGPKEHIPMEYVNTLPPAVCLQRWDRVHFPGRSDEVFMRRRYPLLDKQTGQNSYSTFMKDVKKAHTLRHEHIADIWGSYTSENAGYALSQFVGEHTLATYIDHRTPMQLLRVAPSARPLLMLEWIHCLADALASLHHRGIAHAAIRPSNIWIDHDNRIAFADVGTLRTFQRGKKAPKMETYDYAAPESHTCKLPTVVASSPPISSLGAFSRLRKMSSSGSSSSASSASADGSTRSNSLTGTLRNPITTPSSGRSNSLTNITAALSTFLPRPSTTSSSSSIRNFSRHLSDQTYPSPSISMSARCITPVTILPLPIEAEPGAVRDLPAATPEMSDIYSLACIFLDLVTFVIRGKTTEFVKFRSTRTHTPENKNRVWTDRSFHADPDRIEAWMELLKDDAWRLARENSTFRGIPSLLDLLRKMMSHNAQLRPTAREVRGKIQAILVDGCGFETLCCAGRQWNLAAPESVCASPDRDSSSVAIDLVASHDRHAEHDPRADTVLDAVNAAGSPASIHKNVSSPRRMSTASAAAARVSSWRHAFSKAR
jgi:serine/threonine protein kinase